MSEKGSVNFLRFVKSGRAGRLFRKSSARLARDEQAGMLVLLCVHAVMQMEHAGDPVKAKAVKIIFVQPESAV